MRKKKIMAGMALLCMITGGLAGCGAKGEAMDGGRGIYNTGHTTSGGADGTSEWKLSSSGVEGSGSSDGSAAKMPAGAGEDSAGDMDMVIGESMPMEPAEMPDMAGGDIKEGESADSMPEFPPENRIEPQAGLLTGGEWRDNENWGFFVNLVQTGRFQFQTFGMKPYERVVVQALADGRPMGQVKVKLNTASGNTIATAVTDHEGKAYLYYNVYGGAEEPAYAVLIKPDGSQVQASIDGAQMEGVIPGQDQENPEGAEQGADNPKNVPQLPEGASNDADGQRQDGSENTDGQPQETPIAVAVREMQSQGTQQEENAIILRSTELTVEIGETTPSIRALDLMFVFDTTGSMGDELLYLQKEFEDIAARVADQSTRFCVNFYRDHGDEYVVRSNPFSDDIKATASLINAEYANGGGDYEEAVDEALLDAVAGHTWREEAVKLMFLILDAPPHDIPETNANLKAAVEEAAAQGIRIIPIASSGVNEKTEGFLRSIAMITGGTYTFLTDDSGIGGSHLEPTVGAYTVEALNDMVVRLIKEYYAE